MIDLQKVSIILTFKTFLPKLDQGFVRPMTY